MMRVWLLLTVGWCALAADPYYQADFPKDEFRARWNKLFDQIGPKATALIPSARKHNGLSVPRQTNEFYYLTGLETHEAYLVLDGRTRKATLFLPPVDPRAEQYEHYFSSADPEAARRLVGVDEVRDVKDLTVAYLQEMAAEPGWSIYLPLAPAEGYAQSRAELVAANQAIAADYWDGQLSREAQLAALVKSRLPKVKVADLSPVLDAMRLVKSEREIALVRRASQIAAMGILEAMRSTRPGVKEYQLEAAARYVFLNNDAHFDAYFAIAPAGNEHAWNAHYYRNSGELKDGDLVLFDYSPEYRYYVSDVTRMWPVNGKFAPWQRQLLGFVLAYRQAVMRRIKPGVTVYAVLEEVKNEMLPLVASTKWLKPQYEAAARKLAETGGGVFSHPVGLTVHDVGNYKESALKPGQVFSIDPAIWVPEDKLYLRYEDVIVVTQDGYENFTEFLPVELDQLEKLVGTGGILQAYPATPGIPKVGH